MKLRAEAIDAGYDGRIVLSKLDLHVERGEIVALVGPNGSGKSTLLRALGRVLKPQGGTVLLDGRSIWLACRRARWPGSWRCCPRARPWQRPDRRRAGVDGAQTPPGLARPAHARRPRGGRVGSARDQHRPRCSGRFIGRCPAANDSGSGWRWRWPSKPRLLLLDEPTTFLDLNHQLEVLDLVRYLNDEHGLTVVMVLHDLNQAARYAGRIVVLKDGCV